MHGPIPGEGMTTPANTRFRLPQQSDEIVTRAGYAYPFALLSLHVYSAANCNIGAVVATIETRLGREDWVLADVANDPADTVGFKAATYTNAKSRQCAIVFTGTDDVDDLLTDLYQAISVLPGVPQQYANGLRYARKQISTTCARLRSVVIAGHSLGGGITQYVNFATGRRHVALTFNAAGLGIGSWAKIGYPNPALPGNIVALYAVPFNPETGQRGVMEPVHLIGVQLGQQVAIPVSTLKRFTHSMKFLLEGIRLQRDYCVANGACK